MTSPVTFTIVSNPGSDAAYNAWAGAISNALDSIGVTKVADTGAVASWGAVVRPTSGTAPHFEIRKLDTPATGACPVYIRLNYGIGAAANSLILEVSTGTGTNGAGVLTGPGSEIAAVRVTPAATDFTARTCYATSDGDGFVLFCSLESASVRFLIAVDRQRRPADGVAAPYPGFPDTGYMRLTFGATSTTVVVDATPGGVASTMNRHPAMIPRTVSAATTMVNAAGQTTFIPYVIATRQGSYFAKMLLAVPLLDTQLGMDMPISYLGDTRTYRALGSTYVGVDVQANPGMACAFWWED